MIPAEAARRTALATAVELGRGAGKVFARSAPTFEEVTELYLARPRLRSEVNRAGVCAQICLHLKDWRNLPLDKITRSTVAARLDERAHKPSAANHLFRNFRTIWNYAQRTAELPETPTVAIECSKEATEGEIIPMSSPHWVARLQS